LTNTLLRNGLFFLISVSYPEAQKFKSAPHNQFSYNKKYFLKISFL
jgi:hypothetical protein